MQRTQNVPPGMRGEFGSASPLPDQDTRHRIPTVEAALASKYAAMVSRNREWEKKQQDAVDFRRIARANYSRVDRDALQTLGDLVFQGGGEELSRFLEIAQRDEPFPV